MNNINIELYIPSHPLNKCIKCLTGELKHPEKTFFVGDVKLIMEELNRCKNPTHNVIIYSNSFDFVSYEDLKRYRTKFNDSIVYTDIVNIKMNQLRGKNLKRGDYTSIHVRCGDKYMECPSQCTRDDDRLNPHDSSIYQKMELSIDFLDKKNLPIFLFTDTQSLKNKISVKYNLNTFKSKISHVASISDFESLLDTIAEFKLLGESERIIMLTETGFCFWSSFLNDVPLYFIDKNGTIILSEHIKKNLRESVNNKNKYTESPYEKIPNELLSRFSMENRIDILDWWIDESVHQKLEWTNDYLDSFIKRFTPDNIKSFGEGQSSYGHEACVFLLKAFEKYDIKNKNVAVIGSQKPWIEAILLNLGNKVTTIEYNVIKVDHKNLSCEDYFDYFEKNENMYDCIVTYSSIEHSGLGRYGDPLDPDGDLSTMDSIHKNLKENGTLIWGAPVGKDALVWNAHRVYGNLRLKLLFEKFREIEWISSYTKETLLGFPLRNNGNHPVIVLKKS